MPTIKPYEIIHRYNDGSWSVAARTQTVYEDGTTREGPTVPLSGVTDPVFDEIKQHLGELFGEQYADLVVERDGLQADLVAANDAITAKDSELQSTIAAKDSELQSTIAAKEALESQVAALQARIAELEAQPVQQVATNFQIRAWLITKYGVGIIDQVKALIAAIPDPVEKVLAEQQWEYANNVFRNNPFVERIGTALGLTKEQLDTAYAEACQIL